MELSDLEYYKSCFNYCEETGTLYWSFSRSPQDFKTSRGYNVWKSQCAGLPAGGTSLGRYFISKTSRGKVFNHRIIWLLSYGEWPKGVIDHIDGNGFNNKLENLRDVTQSENMRNARMKSSNKSGVTGVSWSTQREKWIASGYYITDNGDYKALNLGGFSDIDDAINARQKWEDSQGDFTERHGK